MRETAYLRHALTASVGARNEIFLRTSHLEDGSKVMASAWQNTGYLGIPEIEEGARLTLTFERAKNDISYLRKVEKNEGE